MPPSSPCCPTPRTTRCSVRPPTSTFTHAWRIRTWCRRCSIFPARPTSAWSPTRRRLFGLLLSGGSDGGPQLLILGLQRSIVHGAGEEVTNGTENVNDG